MELLLIYMFKMTLTSSVMFGYYYLFLKDKTFHHYNRFYLLSIPLISLFLPFLKVSDFTIKVNAKIYNLLIQVNSFHLNSEAQSKFDFSFIFYVLTGIVCVLLLSKLVLGLIKIQGLKKQFKKEEFQGISFYQTSLENAPFSFLKNLFWKESILLQSDLGKQILKHEMVHIEQKHTLDKLYIELIMSFFWFNPIFWLIKKEIHIIHEYLADHKAIKQMDTRAFAQMLLASHFSGTVIPATSPFLNSNLKKRLNMLKQPKTKFGYVRRVLALPLVFVLAFAYSVNAKNKEIENTNRSLETNLINLKKDTIKPKSGINKIFIEQQRTLNKKQKKISEQKLKEHEEKKKSILESERKMKEIQKFSNEDRFKAKEVELKAKEAELLAREKELKAKESELKAKEVIVVRNTETKPSQKTSLLDRDDVTFIIDGVEVSNQKFKELNPNDIESINVMKKGKDYPRNEIQVKTKKRNLQIKQ